MERYRLVSAVTIPTNVDVCWRKNGSVVYGFVRLEPGEEYEMEDDALLRKSLIGSVEKVAYTKDFEEKLKENNVKYDIVPPSCHCRKTPSIVFHNVEVFQA